MESRRTTGDYTLNIGCADDMQKHYFKGTDSVARLLDVAIFSRFPFLMFGKYCVVRLRDFTVNFEGP